MYSLFVCAAIKKSHYSFNVYHYPIILIPLGNWTFKCFYSKQTSLFFSNLMPKGGNLVLPPSTFQTGEDNYPSSFAHDVVFVKFELQTHKEHLSSLMVRNLVVFVSIFSFQCIHNVLSAITYLSFCYAIPEYLYHILLLQ